MQKRMVIRVISDLKARSKRAAIAELVNAASSLASVKDPDRLVDDVLQRERKDPTALDQGIAVPHAITSSVSDLVVVFGRSEQGIRFSGQKKPPSHLIFLLAVPGQKVNRYLSTLGAIAKLATNHSTDHEKLFELTKPTEIRQYLKKCFA